MARTAGDDRVGIASRMLQCPFQICRRRKARPRLPWDRSSLALTVEFHGPYRLRRLSQGRLVRAARQRSSSLASSAIRVRLCGPNGFQAMGFSPVLSTGSFAAHLSRRLPRRGCSRQFSSGRNSASTTSVVSCLRTLTVTRRRPRFAAVCRRRLQPVEGTCLQAPTSSDLHPAPVAPPLLIACPPRRRPTSRRAPRPRAAAPESAQLGSAFASTW